MFLFVWYPKQENAMSDNVSVGAVTGASVLSWSGSVGCVGIDILAKGEGREHNMLLVCWTSLLAAVL